MDAQVARRDDPALRDLMAKFVCVRAVRMREKDLALFQFDWDLTWGVFLMNGDKTIYGRYATRCGENGRPVERTSIPGLCAALEGALELHAQYPKNRAALTAKTGPVPEDRRVEDFPAFKGRFAGEQACVHCHHVYEGFRETIRQDRKTLPDEWFYPWPMPDLLGLELDVDQRATVKTVKRGSAAETAGFRAGDRIAEMGGQPILSIADVQWVLHRAKMPGKVAVDVVRDGKSEALVLALAKDWRKTDVSWRESTGAMRPKFRCDDLDDASRTKLGLAKDAFAMKVRFAAPKGEAAAAGLKAGDLILQVNDVKRRMDETEFLSYLQQTLNRGDKVDLHVAEGKKRRRLEIHAP